MVGLAIEDFEAGGVPPSSRRMKSIRSGSRIRLDKSRRVFDPHGGGIERSVASYVSWIPTNVGGRKDERIADIIFEPVLSQGAFLVRPSAFSNELVFQAPS